MKRLLALLLILAAPAFAQPPQWAEEGGKHKNNAVAADPSAQHRGGVLLVNPATGQMELLPWTDEDGDSITLDFILPGAIENVSETPVGWEGDVAGTNWSVGVADLTGVKGLGKLSTALDDFTAPGAQSYVRIPIAEVPLTGDWRPVEKQLGNDWRDFGFYIQSALTAQQILDGFSQPAWAVDSIAIYHLSKRNDQTNGPKYMTGKAAHLPAPVAVGFRSNGTTITGWTYGAWEVDDQTGILTKVFDASVIQSWNNTADVVLDATLGFTGVGSANHSTSRGLSGTIGVLPAGSSITALTAYFVSTNASWLQLYTDDATALPDSPISDARWTAAVGSGNPTNAFVSESITPVEVVSQELWIGILRNVSAGQHNIGVDSQTNKLAEGSTTAYPVGSAPDPWPSGGQTWSTFAISAYATYEDTPAPVPDAPTNPAAVGGDEEVTVSWTDAPTADTHNLYWALSSPVDTGDNKITSATTPYIHTGRTNGVEYFYAVAGENAGGEGALSSEVSATPAAPAVGGDTGSLNIGIGIGL